MRYILGIINVSSQGEQCMVIPMVGLVIMVMFISDSASDVKKTGTGGIISGGDGAMKFSVFHFPYVGFHELKLRINASSFGDRSVCFSVKENSESAQVQEHNFKGSISFAESNALLAL